jgi:hypothetical protein
MKGFKEFSERFIDNPEDLPKRNKNVPTAKSDDILDRIYYTICDCLERPKDEEVDGFYNNMVKDIKDYAEEVGLNEENAEDLVIWFAIQYNIKKWQAIDIANDARVAAKDAKKYANNVLGDIKDKIDELCED